MQLRFSEVCGCAVVPCLNVAFVGLMRLGPLCSRKFAGFNHRLKMTFSEFFEAVCCTQQRQPGLDCGKKSDGNSKGNTSI